MLAALWTGLAAAVVYLDTTALGQWMICQPIVACPAFGWCIGRPEIGLFYGVAFQLIWLGSLPIGAAKFPEGNVGAIVATAVAATVPPVVEGEPAWIVIAIGTIIGVITAYLGGELTPVVRRIMNEIAAQIVVAAEAGNALRFRLIFLKALSIHIAAGLILGSGGFLIGKWLLSLYLGPFFKAGINSGVLQFTDEILSGLWPALLGVGAAVIALRFLTKKSVGPAALIAAVSGTAGWLWLC